MAADPRSRSRKKRAFLGEGSPWPPLLFFLLLSSIVLLRWRALEERERGYLGELVAAEAERLTTRIELDFGNRLATLERMVRRWEKRGGTPREEFLADASEYFADAPGFQAIEWIDPELVVRWIAPLEGNEAALDARLSDDPQRRATLERARAEAAPRATPPLDLMQGGRGFLLYLPLRRGESPDGFIVAAFRIEAWLDHVFNAEDFEAKGDFALSIRLNGAKAYELGDWEAGSAAWAEARAETSLLGLGLELAVRPSIDYLERARSRVPLITALAGLLVSLLAAAVLRLLIDARAETRKVEAARRALEAEVRERERTEAALEASGRELEARVEERTRALTAAHARLVEQRQVEQDLETAGEVQADLMSTLLPLAEGYEFASRARASRHVTGDFLDCQLLGEDYCSVMLADIAGKGLSAALIASSARSLYRLALNDECGRSLEESSRPSELLALLNAQLLRDLELSERFVTMTAARLDLGGGLVEIANAGGCAPILFDGLGGRARLLERGGFPLGLFPSLSVEAETARIPPGSGILLYSDGLTEAEGREGELFGVARLLEVVAANAGLGAEGLADAVLGAVLGFAGGSQLSDDATLFVATALPRRHRLDFAASLDSLDSVPQRVARLCAPYGPAFARDLELACSEALSNIREHGYGGAEGPVSLELELGPGGAELRLREEGAAFDPGEVPEPRLGELREGGLGLYLIRSLTDTFTYRPGGEDGNLWTLTKRRRPDGADQDRGREPPLQAGGLG